MNGMCATPYALEEGNRDMNDSKIAFEEAKRFAQIYGTNLLTRIILEERGELTDELRESKEQTAQDIENLIRRMVRIGLAQQEQETK